jgi:FAD:protein FMN transferase
VTTATGAATPGGVVPFTRARELMGTVFSFDVRGTAGGPGPAAAVDAAVDWLRWADLTFSTYKEASEVNRFDRGELAAGDCCPEMRHIMALCHRFQEQTDGYFDAWATGHFDPSGIVKGWAVQQASLALARAGYAAHVVDGGGDIVLSGSPGDHELWKVGVRHPFQPGAYCARLWLPGGAIATSGTYERGHHVVDPRTGRPATDLVAVTIVGPDMVSADAYATAALAMGVGAPGWLGGLEGYESQVVSSSGRGWWTPGFERLSTAPTA